VIPWRLGDTIASEPLTRGVEWMEVFGQHLKEQCVDRFKALSIPTGNTPLSTCPDHNYDPFAGIMRLGLEQFPTRQNVGSMTIRAIPKS
jgi:hypothetical protein